MPALVVLVAVSWGGCASPCHVGIWRQPRQAAGDCTDCQQTDYLRLGADGRLTTLGAVACSSTGARFIAQAAIMGQDTYAIEGSRFALRPDSDTPFTGTAACDGDHLSIEGPGLYYGGGHWIRLEGEETPAVSDLLALQCPDGYDACYGELFFPGQCAVDDECPFSSGSPAPLVDPSICRGGVCEVYCY